MMYNERAFKPSLTKRVMAWGLIVGFGAMLIALLIRVLSRMASEPAEELWSTAAISAFLLFLVAFGAGILRSSLVLGEDTIQVLRPFTTRTYRVWELGGFNTFMIVVHFVPMLQIRLSGYGLKQVGVIPINFGDQAEVEQWFLAKLPVVVDDGSPILPKPRYRDVSGQQRDPTFRGS